MKNFTKLIMLILFLATLILVVLDFGYTNVYETSSVTRTKFQYLRSFKNKKIDYIFLGSSRVENTVVPLLIEKELGKTALNLGFQASKLSDVYTVLQLIKEYNITVTKIFIQVDYIFNLEDGFSNVFQYELMPFIRENKVTKEYFERHFRDNECVYYFPFYRYFTYEPKIGFREFIMNGIHKKTKIVENKGFVSLYGNSFEHKNALPNQINTKNKYYDKIKSYAEKNNISVAFFCAPFCKHTENLDFVEKLKKKIPGLYDYSQSIDKDDLFHNCSHLNEEGAKVFTKIIIKKMLLNTPE